MGKTIFLKSGNSVATDFPVLLVLRALAASRHSLPPASSLPLPPPRALQRAATAATLPPPAAGLIFFGRRLPRFWARPSLTEDATVRLLTAETSHGRTADHRHEIYGRASSRPRGRSHKCRARAAATATVAVKPVATEDTTVVRRRGHHHKATATATATATASITA